jgi:hypothetical protein
MNHFFSTKKQTTQKTFKPSRKKTRQGVQIKTGNHQELLASQYDLRTLFPKLLKYLGWNLWCVPLLQTPK